MSEKTNLDSAEKRDETAQKPELTEEELRQVAGGQTGGATDLNKTPKTGKG